MAENWPRDARRLGGRGRGCGRRYGRVRGGAARLRRAVVVGDRGLGEPLESDARQRALDPLVAEMLAKIFDPKAWFSGTNDLDEALQKMAEGPRLSDLWNVERKFLAVFNAWVALRRRTLENNTVTLDAWTRAAGAFAKELNGRAEKAEKLDSWREMLALWVETANTTLLETQRSEAFLKTQRETLKASTDLRLAQRELAEYYSEMFGISDAGPSSTTSTRP